MPFVRTYSKFILPILCSVVSSYAHSAEQDHGEQKDGKGTEETRVTSGAGGLSCSGVNSDVLSVMESFLKDRSAAGAESEGLAKDAARLLGMAKTESSFNTLNVTDMNSKGTDGRSNSSSPEVFEDIMAEGSGVALNHETNFGLWQLSADRFALHPHDSLSALSSTFGLSAQGEVSSKKGGQYFAESYGKYESLESSVNKNTFFDRCGTPRDLRNHDRFKSLPNTLGVMSGHVSLMGGTMRSDASVLDQSSRSSVSYLGSLLAACPRLNLEMAYNELQNQKKTEAEGKNNFYFAKVTRDGQPLCEDSIRAFLAGVNTPEKLQAPTELEPQPTPDATPLNAVSDANTAEPPKVVGSGDVAGPPAPAPASIPTPSGSDLAPSPEVPAKTELELAEANLKSAKEESWNANTEKMMDDLNAGIEQPVKKHNSRGRVTGEVPPSDEVKLKRLNSAIETIESREGSRSEDQQTTLKTWKSQRDQLQAKKDAPAQDTWNSETARLITLLDKEIDSPVKKHNSRGRVRGESRPTDDVVLGRLNRAIEDSEKRSGAKSQEQLATIEQWKSRRNELQKKVDAPKIKAWNDDTSSLMMSLDVGIDAPAKKHNSRGRVIGEEPASDSVKLGRFNEAIEKAQERSGYKTPEQEEMLSQWVVERDALQAKADAPKNKSWNDETSKLMTSFDAGIDSPTKKHNSRGRVIGEEPASDSVKLGRFNEAIEKAQERSGYKSPEQEEMLSRWVVERDALQTKADAPKIRAWNEETSRLVTNLDGEIKAPVKKYNSRGRVIGESPASDSQKLKRLEDAIQEVESRSGAKSSQDLATLQRWKSESEKIRTVVRAPANASWNEDTSRILNSLKTSINAPVAKSNARGRTVSYVPASELVVLERLQAAIAEAEGRKGFKTPEQLALVESWKSQRDTIRARQINAEAARIRAGK